MKKGKLDINGLEPLSLSLNVFILCKTMQNWVNNYTSIYPWFIRYRFMDMPVSEVMSHFLSLLYFIFYNIDLDID